MIFRSVPICWHEGQTSGLIKRWRRLVVMMKRYGLRLTIGLIREKHEHSRILATGITLKDDFYREMHLLAHKFNH
jgi:hypothetical protein